jgi:hypothetical protein
MVRNVAEEALALASLTLFLAMVAVWAEVLGGIVSGRVSGMDITA